MTWSCVFHSFIQSWNFYNYNSFERALIWLWLISQQPPTKDAPSLIAVLQNSTNLFFRSYTLSFSFSVLHEDVVGFVDGRSSSAREFPYKTNVGRFNPAEVFTGRYAPVSPDTAEEQQLGG